MEDLLNSLDQQVRQDVSKMAEGAYFSVSPVRVANIIARVVQLAESGNPEACKLDEIKQAKALALLFGGHPLFERYGFAQPEPSQCETAPAPEPRKGEYLIPVGARDAACRSCGAPVLWITTAKGSAMPLSVATIEARDGERYAISHFSDCPQAKGWSKKSRW